jgi:aspartyl-tRNA synthetase
MFRTHTCGELRIENINSEVTLAGWVQRIRDFGGMSFIDLRDRYGITQLVIDEDTADTVKNQLAELGREFVVQVKGAVRERSNKNKNIPTGEVEIAIAEITILSPAELPPFTIEDDTDGGDDIRMKYRYLDLRRNPVRENLVLRSKMAHAIRSYLNDREFIETETPVLIKSTPEGARDFVVPSRMNEGEFYALPQSPQTFKQLLMIGGFDRYYQIVKCFRDEDLRADRQPEFTQIDCEMSFVTRDEILSTFEGLTKHLFQSAINVALPDFPLMSYDEAIEKYGSDKPDTRFEMLIHNLNSVTQNKGFKVFDESELVGGICVKGQVESYSRKMLDQVTDWVRRPQIGAKGLVYVKFNLDGTIKSSVDKFYSFEDLKAWGNLLGAEPGDLLFVMSGEEEKTLTRLGALRLEIGKRHNLMNPTEFKPLWVVDFPLLEWIEEANRFHAMHHPFTAPKKADMDKMLGGDHETMKSLRADAYDLVINGVEIGGGSIRIHDRALQEKNFKLLGFTDEEAEAQFGFLLGAFEYGAPPHGGIAFGFDRLCAVMHGDTSIRDFIAFPKNNMGRDIMIDAPSPIAGDQLEELHLQLDLKKD